MDGAGSLIILVGFFALLWFLMIRPQQKKQKQHTEMLARLSPGDDVITIGGLHGRVLDLGEDSVDLEVTDDVVLRFRKSSIGSVVAQQATADAAESDESEQA